MERRTRVLIAGALAGLLTLPAGLALAQQAATAPPTSLRALKIADKPAVVSPPSSVTRQGARNLPPQGRQQNDPQSGAQGDGQTGGPQSTSPNSGASQPTAEPPQGTSLPPIAPPEASGKN